MFKLKATSTVSNLSFFCHYVH